MTKVPFSESRRLLIVTESTVGHEEREEEVEERQEVESDEEKTLISVSGGIVFTPPVGDGRLLSAVADIFTPSSFVDCFTKPARRRIIALAHEKFTKRRAQAAAQKTRGAPGTMDVARGTVVVAIGTGAVPIGTCAVAMGTGFA